MILNTTVITWMVILIFSGAVAFNMYKIMEFLFSSYEKLDEKSKEPHRSIHERK